jgi:hypothetical protein
MKVSRNKLCWNYALISVVVLIGTWGNAFEYLDLGFISATALFWRETLATPASRFITVDTLFLGLSVVIWMVLEARRINLKWVLVYIAAGLLVAISVAVPLLLIHREQILASHAPADQAGTLTIADVAGLILLAVSFCSYTVIALQT